MEHVIKVLVTDDEDGMRLGVQRALRNYSCEVEDLDATITYNITLAGSGEETLDILKESKFDLMLLDYKLPGINGIETLGEASKIDSELVVVIMTAYASLETAVTATKKGAYDFLAKPFTPAELRSKVRKATRSLILTRQARKLAEEKKRLRFEFISVLSHELKAPIGAVEGYLDLIQKGHVKDEETMNRIIGRSLVRLGGMRKLIFDLLDLTRIESGTKTRQLETVDVKEVATTAVELCETQASERGIRIDLEVTGETSLYGDSGELEIVLNNLVSNAVKYNRDNGTVHVRLYGYDDRIKVEVVDTGIGMTKDEAAKLFGEFVRIKNAKTRNIEGSGLGLSTVKKIIKLYDGDIDVKSVPDEGTTFTAVLRRPTEGAES